MQALDPLRVEHVGLGPGAAPRELAGFDQPDLEALATPATRTAESSRRRSIPWRPSSLRTSFNHAAMARRSHGIGPEAADVGRQAAGVGGPQARSPGNADHVHVGMHVDSGRVRLDHAQAGLVLDGGRRRRLRPARHSGVVACVGSWCRLPCEKGNKCRREPRGEQWNCSFPNGIDATMTLRVTNGRVAASRARLHDGHEAPVPCRPRTHAG